jgi:cytoskeletal protein RodZ
MSDFGGKLRLARERRGISLRQIAASTKISVAALEALERNDVSKLPGGIFSRAFVRSYAVEVGLDPDETVREFLGRFQGDAVTAPAAPAAIPDEESNFESQQRMAGVVLKLLLVSVPLIVLLLYFTLRSRPTQHTAANTPIPAPSQAPQSRVPPEALPPAPAPAIPQPGPVATQPKPAVLAPPVKSMTLELHPTGDCWIKLTVDGQEVLSRIMLAGEKDVRQVRDSALIEVGNAGAFAFSVDGRPGKPLGQEGQVRTARITRDTLARYVQ